MSGLVGFEKDPEATADERTVTVFNGARQLLAIHDAEIATEVLLRQPTPTMLNWAEDFTAASSDVTAAH